jgi:hypothetical protein
VWSASRRSAGVAGSLPVLSLPVELASTANRPQALETVKKDLDVVKRRQKISQNPAVVKIRCFN